MTVTPRPSHDEWGLRAAEWAAQRATCFRRSVGCALFNQRRHSIATGYNGRASGLKHCNERGPSGTVGPYIDHAGRNYDFPFACAGAKAPSGTQLDACEAIHAEQNALLQCSDVYSIWTCYVTHSPCVTCVKLLMNTSCARIVFRNRYAHDEAAQKLWLESREQLHSTFTSWVHLPQ